MTTRITQLSLFDASGAVPFECRRDAKAPVIPCADFHVAGMDFKVAGHDDQEAILDDVMEGMGNLHRLDVALEKDWLRGADLLDISTWERNIHAKVRASAFDTIIDVSKSKGFVLVSLPALDLWPVSGLQWLLHFQHCCPRNFANPTPWLGRLCDCMPTGR